MYYLSALSALSLSSAVYADQATTAPDLAGGITASLGTMWVVPSAANTEYATSIDLTTANTSFLSIEPDYEWGLLASLGYVFENTANMVEFSYRGLFDASSSSSVLVDESSEILPKNPRFTQIPLDGVKSKLEFEHHSIDLMFSQFMNLGEHMQVRFSVGGSYVDFEQKQSSTFTQSQAPDFNFSLTETAKTDYTGFGPRVGIDGRYDFGQGFGIVAGGSAAYYLGDLDTSAGSDGIAGEQTASYQYKNNKSDHGVTNLRGNVGIDYVYFFDNDARSTVGIEVGYMADWYDEMAGELDLYDAGDNIISNFDTTSVLFSGPYVLIKGAF